MRPVTYISSRTSPVERTASGLRGIPGTMGWPIRWVGRWASLSTIGAEPTGLYFDKFNANAAPGLLHSVLRGAVTNLLNLLVFFILLIFFAVFLPGFFTNFLLLFVLFLFFL